MEKESDAAAATVLDIEELSHAIGERTLFEGLSLSLHSGESVAVTGPSGSGKSTLLSCVLGLIKPDRGSVRVTGTDITQLRSSQLARVRAQSIGMVFQFGELLPELSPVDNVVLASLLARGKRTDRRGGPQAFLRTWVSRRPGRARSCRAENGSAQRWLGL